MLYSKRVENIFSETKCYWFLGVSGEQEIEVYGNGEQWWTKGQLTPGGETPTNKGIFYSNKSYKWDTRNKKYIFETSKFNKKECLTLI